jgi:hypothetical protein
MTFSQKLAMSHASHVGEVFFLLRAGQSFAGLAGASVSVLMTFSTILPHVAVVYTVTL